MNPKNSKIFTKSLRAAVLGTALVGAAATVGCSGDAVSVVDQTVETDLAGIQQVRKDVHFTLAAAPAGSRYELDLGAKTYELAAHDSASAARAGALLQSAEAPTHFVPEASFSREAPQSFRVFRVDAKGNRFMVLAGIHVPGENGQSKGDKTPIDVNLEDAAEYIVFHDPALLTIDADAAAKVKAHIRKTPAFARLVAAVKAYGGATTMDQQDQGYQGWAVMLPSLDSKGKQVFIKSGKGMVPATHWAIAGSPEFYKAGFGDVIDPRTKNRVETPFEAAALARKQARLAVRADAALLDVMYTQNTDTTVRATKHMLGAGAEDLQWTLDDTQWKGDRRISIVKTEGQKVTFKVENNQWRRFGVFVRFRDANGNLVSKEDMGEEKPESEPQYKWFNDRKDITYSTLLEIVDGRFTVLGVPLSDETVKQFTVKMPEKAASMEVNIASAGARRVETPAYVGTELEPNITVPGSIHTYLMDVAMPLMALSMGAGATALSALHGHELMVDLASIGVEVGAKIIMAAIASGTAGASAFTSEFASEILAEVIAKQPKLAADLIAWAAEVGAEKALEGAMGAVGAVIEAIEVVGTVAGIAETLGTLANNAPIVYDRISTSETLKLRITPKADETTHAPGMFGPQAKVAKAAIYYGSSTVPTIVSAPIDWTQNKGNGPKEILFAVPQQPIGGEVRVKVSLDNGHGWTAAEGEAERDNHPPKGSSDLDVDVEVENNPTPINGETRYVHDRVLTMKDGKREFVSTSQAPAVTAPQVCNTADTTKPYLCGQSSLTLNSAGILGYSWTGSGQGLKTCDGASMVRASMAQTLNLNPAFGTPDDLRQSLDCGRTAPVFLAFDPTGKPASGRHVMVQPVKGVYQVYGIDISKKGSLEPANENLVLGTFRSKNLDVIVSNPATGMLLGLDESEGTVEVLKLADKPVPVAAAPQGLAVGGEGKAIGRLHNATNLAFLPMGAGFVVLEGGADGTPGRIQAFTFDGASALLFGSDAAFPLKDEGGKKVTYTDMKIDPTESFVYVTSYVGDAPKPGDYRLDIYRIGDGGFVSRTEGVVAAKIAIDRWRDLYTLNYANLEGSANPEPSVSEWLAPVVDPK